MTSITVVTPWHNHPEFADDYWAAMRIANATALVIDNASEPPIPGAHRLDVNAGFSRACNIGLNVVATDAVLFLNNDIVATREDWLDEIRAALEPGVLVGAQLRYDAHGDVDGVKLPYLDGWCVAGMRSDLLDLGGWDEAYEEPSYYGDNDLSLRARAAGMTLLEVPVGLRHLGNGTAKHMADRAQWASDLNRQRFHRVARELIGMEVAA